MSFYVGGKWVTEKLNKFLSFTARKLERWDLNPDCLAQETMLLTSRLTISPIYSLLKFQFTLHFVTILEIFLNCTFRIMFPYSINSQFLEKNNQKRHHWLGSLTQVFSPSTLPLITIVCLIFIQFLLCTTLSALCLLTCLFLMAHMRFAWLLAPSYWWASWSLWGICSSHVVIYPASIQGAASSTSAKPLQDCFF